MFLTGTNIVLLKDAHNRPTYCNYCYLTTGKLTMLSVHASVAEAYHLQYCTVCATILKLQEAYNPSECD